jgi:DNA-binding MarR family transcriptional regulator
MIPIMAAEDLIPLLVADVYELAGSFRRLGDAIAGTVGQSQARWQVLSAVSGGGKTVPRIARRLGLARQSVQRVADLLVGDGLCDYLPNPDHKRSPLVRLTIKGETQLRKLSAAADHRHRELAQKVRAKDLAVTHRVLRVIRDALDEG